MSRLFSNGPQKDFVINPFTHLLDGSQHMHLAAPYFTQADPIFEAARKGKTVQLLIGLNEATSQQALRKIHEVPGIAIRYLTSRFHAKIFIDERQPSCPAHCLARNVADVSVVASLGMFPGLAGIGRWGGEAGEHGDAG